MQVKLSREVWSRIYRPRLNDVENVTVLTAVPIRLLRKSPGLFRKNSLIGPHGLHALGLEELGYGQRCPAENGEGSTLCILALTAGNGPSGYPCLKASSAVIWTQCSSRSVASHPDCLLPNWGTRGPVARDKHEGRGGNFQKSWMGSGLPCSVSVHWADPAHPYYWVPTTCWVLFWCCGKSNEQNG